MRAQSSSAADRTRPAGPPGLPLVGHSWSFTRDPLGFLSRVARDYGDVSFLRLAGTDVYFLNHADLVRDVFTAHRAKFEISTLRARLEPVFGKGLLTSRGEMHERQRRLMQPLFRKSRIDSYAGLMAGYTERLCENWQSGAELDVSAEIMKLTMTVAAKALFDYEAEGDSDDIRRNLGVVLEFYAGMMSPFLDLALRLPLPATLRFRRALREMDVLLYRMIEERRHRPAGGSDLLAVLMEARDEQTSAPMNERQLRDELITLLGAGHETTASTLGWTLLLLAQNPEIQARLHEEVRGTLGARATPDAADAARLGYARQVIMEVLRIYPPAWFTGRHALEDVPLEGCRVPKGCNVLMSQYVMHRDARYFPEPERFMPDRWSAAFLQALPRGAYFPFSAGDRHCIGESFAWLETVLVLATLVARWRFEPVAGAPIGVYPSITLRPDRPVRLRVERR